MAAIWIPAAKLTEIVGSDAALVLLRTYGGRSLYLRQKSPHPALVDLIGMEAAMALSEHYGGSDAMFPSSEVRPPALKQRICAMIEAGLGNQQIVRECGCTARYVSEIRRDLGRPDRTRRTPMKQEILRLLRGKRKVDDQVIAAQTGAAVAYVGQIRSALRRGLIA